MEHNNSIDDVLEGVLFLYSETGTEGGYWAFQDSRYIKKDIPQAHTNDYDTYEKEQNRRPQARNNIVPGEKNIGDSWSYSGLHILQNGDRLAIYDPANNEKVWSGAVNLKRLDPLSEHASGMRIHADQIGIERDVWAAYFFLEYRARLIPKRA